MTMFNPIIFRPEALRRHMLRNERSVYPKLVSPRAFLLIWLLLALALAAAVLAWIAEVPEYVSGTAVAVASEGSSEESRGETLLVIFLPPEKLNSLRPGQKVFFSLREGIDDEGTLLAVEPSVLTPPEARSRYALDVSAELMIREPVTVATARVKQARSGIASYRGSFGRAHVEVGARRAITLFPVVGSSFFKDEKQLEH